MDCSEAKCDENGPSQDSAKLRIRLVAGLIFVFARLLAGEEIVSACYLSITIKSVSSIEKALERASEL